MNTKYNRVNRDFSVPYTISEIQRRNKKLPLMFQFLMNDSCKYIGGRSNVDEFVHDYRKTATILIEDMSKPEKINIITRFKKDLSTIKNIYGETTNYYLDRITKRKFDGNLEIILTKYIKR